MDGSTAPTYDDLMAIVRRLEERIKQLEAENARLRQENASLRQQLDQARRAGKRQASPFSKGPSKETPKTPGRKAGDAHGRHGHRPPPEQIDEQHVAALPEVCPQCGVAHGIERTGTAEQFQTDIETRPVVRRFEIPIGTCRNCGKRVQARHPLQTSDAIGAAASQIGPTAAAAVTLLNKQMGLSHGKVAAVCQSLLGIDLTRGGACRAMQRVAGKLEPARDEIVQAMPSQPMIVPDETGWRIGGQPAWLHVFASPTMTLYQIARGRGADMLAEVIGWDYEGVLVHDGWRPYDQFMCARHQTCLAHLLRRCGEMIEASIGTARKFPTQVKALLKDALGLRDARSARQAAGEVIAEQVDGELELLESRRDALLAARRTNADNQRLAAHLARNAGNLFTFLIAPAADGSPIDATNWRAEQAIRPAVVNRKVFGGNRTPRGADDQATLCSVLRTCWQRGISFLRLAAQTLLAPTPAARPPLLTG